MNTRKLIGFFHRYALLVVVIGSLVTCSAAYAGIYVNNVLGGELQNATVSASMVVSIPIKYVGDGRLGYSVNASVPRREGLNYGVGYACAVIANNVTVPCFTISTTTQATITTTTSAVVVVGGAGGVVADNSTYTPTTRPQPNTPMSPTLPPLTPPQAGLPPAANVGLGIIIMSVAGAALYSEIRRRRKIPTLFRARYRYKPVRWGKRTKKWWEE